MLSRFCSAAAFAVGCVLAVIGLLAVPGGALIAWMVLAAFVGSLVALYIQSARPDSVNVWRLGAALSAAMMAASLVVTGLIVLLGAIAAAALLLWAAAVVAVWLRRRANPVTSHVPLVSAAVAPRAVLVEQPQPCRPAQRTFDINTATASTDTLRAAWQRTYWLLRDLPPTSLGHWAVFDLWVRLLDEFERRDPDAFARWLNTGPRAGSDPGRYLSTDVGSQSRHAREPGAVPPIESPTSAGITPRPATA
ncbi:hypothetical protein [Kibdelosporangium phytohabitans]|uniref:Uncharacterized protein n=1 Tax=Kibdelosporangium phytohabitans TaxID=860235 RepID=A0A0N7F3Y5_9PSEU|nr:hypothetical protein [Kibdelosporangium phytohabitans]ALG09927.1 hypothetical protein AOZ06_26210 [Kibdelosporangium phytohabitans]MBE1468666.1 multisubunit Na+/H+ antiporter MnhB subunit [Kibdelosporangium phytohabitans]